MLILSKRCNSPLSFFEYGEEKKHKKKTNKQTKKQHFYGTFNSFSILQYDNVSENGSLTAPCSVGGDWGLQPWNETNHAYRTSKLHWYRP